MDTIGVSDMDAEHGMEVELTQTENIVTKMNVKWHLNYAGGGEYAATEADTTQYMILRHNVKQYGLQEQEYDWYIFNQPDIVLKMRDVLADPVVEPVEAGEVSHVLAQVEPGGV